jgi:ribonuclease D
MTTRPGARASLPARTPAEVEQIVERCRRAPRLAVDVEANGLFVYRARLCTVQLAWEEGGGIAVAVIDTIATSVRPLAPIFGPDGPVKVLHDLTFDARLLDESGAPLSRVRDTSVAARFLGFQATGLASLLASELGVTIDKHLQQHDWARRPLTDEQLVYLAGDVRDLLALDDHLGALSRAREIEDEIAEECQHKLGTAKNPPRDGRPAYVRIKGAAALDPVGRAVLRRLVRVREVAAEAADVPPFKVVGNETLLAIAAKLPTSTSALQALPGGASGRAGPLGAAFLHAVAAGIDDGDVPEDERAAFLPVRIDREQIVKRRAVEARISAFRRAEAKLRGVDEQVVLPGHCATELADALLAHPNGDPELEAAVARISGLGACRIARYSSAYAALSEDPAQPRPPPPSS